MAETFLEVEIPNRALFRAAEVCDLVKLQPYVLRSWEAEFPDLGVSKAGGSRVYRKADVEQVVRIKNLLLVDGLTLAGARRKIEGETAPVAADEPAIQELIGRNARERLTAVRRGLQAILDLLARKGDSRELRLSASPSTRRPRARSSSRRPAARRQASTRSASARRAKPARRKPAAARGRSKPRSRSRRRP
jgi:DNA-binding transcriptional MerR regulator